MYRLIAVLVLSCLCWTTAWAEEKQEEVPGDPWQYEVAVQPPKSAEQLEAERWTTLMTNETGNYLFEYESIKPMLEADGSESEQERQVLTRSVFTDEKLLAQLNKNYAAQLAEGEAVSYCDMLLIFDLNKQEYKTLETTLYTKGDRIIGKNSSAGPWKKVPGQSFADTLLKFLLNNRKHNE